VSQERAVGPLHRIQRWKVAFYTLDLLAIGLALFLPYWANRLLNQF
jgi:hypothetical protein